MFSAQHHVKGFHVSMLSRRKVFAAHSCTESWAISLGKASRELRRVLLYPAESISMTMKPLLFFSELLAVMVLDVAIRVAHQFDVQHFVEENKTNNNFRNLGVIQQTTDRNRTMGWVEMSQNHATSL